MKYADFQHQAEVNRPLGMRRRRSPTGSHAPISALYSLLWLQVNIKIVASEMDVHVPKHGVLICFCDVLICFWMLLIHPKRIWIIFFRRWKAVTTIDIGFSPSIWWSKISLGMNFVSNGNIFLSIILDNWIMNNPMTVLSSPMDSEWIRPRWFGRIWQRGRACQLFSNMM